MAGPNLFIAGLAIVTALLYLVAGGRQLLRLEATGVAADRGVAIVGVFAVLAHLSLALLSAMESGLNLGLYRIASLVFLTMASVSLAVLINRPLHMLVIVMFPFAALAVLTSTFAPATGRPLSGLAPGLVLHVTLSVIAYAVVSLAALQAVLVAYQARRLRQKQFRGFVRLLPPLQRMEIMMYELLTAGLVLLTLAIATGALFVEDLFAQHLVHKTVLTVIGWCIIFAVLLGHHRWGLRVNTAVTLTLSGFACLALGFFGSKLVLELVLGAP